MQPTAADDAPRTAGGKLLGVFRHPLFAMVWTTAFISNIGNWMENSAANWAVITAPGMSAFDANFYSEILNFADFLPTLMLSLIAGVIADRVNLRRYLLWLQACACVLGSGLAAAAYLGWASPRVVIAFTFAEGIVWALNGPPWLSVVPHLVPRNELPSAVAASSMQFNLARVFGPVIAMSLVPIGGVKLAFAINALTFFPIMGVFWKMPAGKPREKPPGPPKSLMHDLSDGLKVVWHHPGMRRISLMQASCMFLAAPATGLLAPYVQQRMNGQSGAYGWLLGAIGLGAVFATLTVRRVPAYYPRHHLIPLSVCLAGICMLLFTLTRAPWQGFLALVAMGFFWLMGLNSANAAMQLLAHDTSRGRVMSVMMLSTQGMLTMGHLSAAGLAKLLPPEWVMRLMESALVVSAGCFLLWREPAIDAMERRGSAGTPAGFWPAIWEALTAQSHRRVPEPIRDDMAGEQKEIG